MTAVVAAAIVGAALAAVLAPLLRSRPDGREDAAAGEPGLPARAGLARSAAEGPGGPPAAGGAPAAAPPDALQAGSATEGGPGGAGPASREELLAELERVREEKLAALEGIRALETDFLVGALAEADYAELRRQEEERALELIARADALQAAAGSAAGLEHPVEAEGALEPAGEPARRDAEGNREAGGEAAADRGGVPEEAAPRGRRLPTPVLAAAAGLLLAAGLGIGYLLAARTGPDRTGGTGGPAAGMPAPVLARVQEYRARLERDPRDLEALLGMAALNLQRQDLDQAIDYYKRALGVDPGNPQALTRLGLILGRAGHLEEAIDAFDRALARDPGYLEALWLKGEVQLYGLRDFPGAAETWQQVVRHLPEGPERARALAALAEARGGGRGGAVEPAVPGGAPEPAPR